MKILMVCLGNICRSPLAEGILRRKIEQNGLDWEVDSAGTSAWHQGELPDPRSRHTAAQHGLDLTSQRGRQIQLADLDRFDLVLVMDQSNLQDVLRLTKGEVQREKVKKMLDFSRSMRGQDVPDPYWDDDGFEKVYQMLDEACEGLIAHYTDNV